MQRGALLRLVANDHETMDRWDGGRPLTSGYSYMIRCMTAGTLSAPNARWPVAA